VQQGKSKKRACKKKESDYPQAFQMFLTGTSFLAMLY
jgi:hypothetical protein